MLLFIYLLLVRLWMYTDVGLVLMGNRIQSISPTGGSGTRHADGGGRSYAHVNTGAWCDGWALAYSFCGWGSCLSGLIPRCIVGFVGYRFSLCFLIGA